MVIELPIRVVRKPVRRDVTPLRSIAFIGNSLPAVAGLLPSHGPAAAISTSRSDLETSIVADDDHGQAYDYPLLVALQIKDGNIEDYVRAADS